MEGKDREKNEKVEHKEINEKEENKYKKEDNYVEY